MEEEEGNEVMSELHLGQPTESTSCLSFFTISESPISISSVNYQLQCARDNQPTVFGQSRESIEFKVTEDENGDLVMPRRPKRLQHVQNNCNVISIHHQLKTYIPDVGLQIWRGSLLLGDFVLHKMKTTNEIDNIIAVELGCGTGLLGILMAARARVVFLTDFSTDILDNCHRNVILNSHGSKTSKGTIKIRQLDWQEPWPPNINKNDNNAVQSNCSLQYSWDEADIVELEMASIILAADVIYNDSATDFFFLLLGKLMPPGSKKVLWLALEKRYNFSLSDLDVVAHGYEHFRSFIDDKSHATGNHDMYADESTHQHEECNQKMFAGKMLQVEQLPQYIIEYERTGDLELWEIWRK